jgi:hypothetical protein
MDDVNLDLGSMVVKRWRTRTLGRTEWAFVMRQFKVLKGCSAKEERKIPRLIRTRE